jgi:hypothetical protein
MNEYTVNEVLGASTEWVITFPTKNFYVDFDLVSTITPDWVPDGLLTGNDPECNSWIPGEVYPLAGDLHPDAIGQPVPNPTDYPGWEGCTYIPVIRTVGASIEPFTTLFQPDGKACESAGLKTWDRDERTFGEERDGERPPVVSPSIPEPCDSSIEFCDEVVFQLCYEVNVMRFGDGVIFGTPDVEGSSLLLSVTPASGPDAEPFANGWGRINFGTDIHHQDFTGLVGLPVTGFAAYEFENNFVDGASIKAFYGGLFGHKANVRRKGRHVHQKGGS